MSVWNPSDPRSKRVKRAQSVNSTPMTTPEYVTTATAAHLLGVSVFTVRKLIKAGELRGAKRGGHGPRSGYRIPRQAITDYLNNLPDATTPTDQEPQP